MYRYANEPGDGRPVRVERCPHCLRRIAIIAMGRQHRRTGFKLMPHNRFVGSRCEGSGMPVAKTEDDGDVAMDGLIIKASADPDDDTYIIWSSANSRPLHLFRTEQDLRDHLWAEFQATQPELAARVRDSQFDPDARVSRANQHGSSALFPQNGTGPSYGFQQKEWVVPCVGGWAMLQRADLVEYTQAFLSGNREDIHKLVSLVLWS